MLFLFNFKGMKKILLLISLPTSLTFSSILAQDDVSLFNYWRYYSNIENVQYKNLSSEAFEQLDKREKDISLLRSKEDWLKRQELVSRKFKNLIGQFPEKTSLNARVTGVLKRDGYQVEKLIYESMPGYFVTAALFIPNKIRGKAPAILNAIGHSTQSFRRDIYQHVIINLVKKGFIVLTYDQIGQGERLQYYDAKTGKSRFASTTEHSYPGAQCFISGYSPAKYFIWDGIRGIDYLLTRREVDPERIGMTGLSGGGTSTAFIAAIDDRILAAAPTCFITNYKYIFKSIGPQDAEQNIYHFLSEGLDHADLIELRAPKPTLIVATTRDFFSIQGARETFREAKMAYKALGEEDFLQMTEADYGHGFTRKNNEATYAFFQEFLNNPGDSSDEEVDIIPEKDLQVTETGQLSTALHSETIYSLNKGVVENQVTKLQLSRSRENADDHIAAVTTEARRLSGFEDPTSYGSAIFSGRYLKKEYILDKYLIPGSGDYMLPVALFRPVEKSKNQVVLILDEQGMKHTAIEDSLMVHSMLKQGYSVLLFDVRGIGSLGPGYLKGDAYIDNTSFNQWFAGILTNKSIVGMRAEDILRIVNFIKSDNGEFETITALAIGATGSELLHAAVFEDDIQKICLLKPFISFADIALSKDYLPAYITSTVAGAIEKYDLSDLMAAICPRKILIINPRKSDGFPANEIEQVSNLNYPKTVYNQNSVEDNFKHSVLGEDRLVHEQIIEWLR
jgi:cephalosporin-C deacetylase-like acetyl esterase